MPAAIAPVEVDLLQTDIPWAIYFSHISVILWLCDKLTFKNYQQKYLRILNSLMPAVICWSKLPSIILYCKPVVEHFLYHHKVYCLSHRHCCWHHVNTKTFYIAALAEISYFLWQIIKGQWHHNFFSTIWTWSIFKFDPDKADNYGRHQWSSLSSETRNSWFLQGILTEGINTIDLLLLISSDQLLLWPNHFFFSLQNILS